MQHRRSPGKLEAKKARNYAYQHSTSTKKNRNDLFELVYTGTPEALTGAVLAELKDLRSGEIPEIPRGLVLSDGRGAGFFDAEHKLDPPVRFTEEVFTVKAVF